VTLFTTLRFGYEKHANFNERHGSLSGKAPGCRDLSHLAVPSAMHEHSGALFAPVFLGDIASRPHACAHGLSDVEATLDAIRTPSIARTKVFTPGPPPPGNPGPPGGFFFFFFFFFSFSIAPCRDALCYRLPIPLPNVPAASGRHRRMNDDPTALTVRP